MGVPFQFRFKVLKCEVWKLPLDASMFFRFTSNEATLAKATVALPPIEALHLIELHVHFEGFRENTDFLVETI